MGGVRLGSGEEDGVGGVVCRDKRRAGRLLPQREMVPGPNSTSTGTKLSQLPKAHFDTSDVGLHVESRHLSFHSIRS